MTMLDKLGKDKLDLEDGHGLVRVILERKGLERKGLETSRLEILVAIPYQLWHSLLYPYLRRHLGWYQIIANLVSQLASMWLLRRQLERILDSNHTDIDPSITSTDKLCDFPMLGESTSLEHSRPQQRGRSVQHRGREFVGNYRSRETIVMELSLKIELCGLGHHLSGAPSSMLSTNGKLKAGGSSLRSKWIRDSEAHKQLGSFL